MRVEPVAAGVVTLIGIGLTTAGVLMHVGQAVAPGAALALLGGGWLGNAVARARPLEKA